MDDADAAFLRQGNREARFGDGIHRRRNQRNVERNIAGKAGFDGSVARQNRRVRGDEQEVVEGVGFTGKPHDANSCSRKAVLYAGGCGISPGQRED